MPQTIEPVAKDEEVIILSTPEEEKSPDDKSISFTGYGSSIDEARWFLSF